MSMKIPRSGPTIQPVPTGKPHIHPVTAESGREASVVSQNPNDAMAARNGIVSPPNIATTEISKEERAALPQKILALIQKIIQELPFRGHELTPRVEKCVRQLGEAIKADDREEIKKQTTELIALKAASVKIEGIIKGRYPYDAAELHESNTRLGELITLTQQHLEFQYR